MISTRETFKKSERLCSRKLITTLFAEGNIFYTRYFKVIWAEAEINSTFPARIAFVVPKKIIRKAVSRNFLKRRMKEAYRKNKNNLYDFLFTENIRIAILVIFRKEEVVEYTVLEAGIREIIQKITAYIEKERTKSKAT